ncbi:MAG: hypothetical protein FJZ01_14120 [Candidatus Sericytochromatia bacterium]|nr:hypothetical protein [Candidatus Tanganyikabacteria bacterium]
MNPLVRNILIIGTILILASLGGGFVLWVIPVEAQIQKLSSELESAKNDKMRADTAIKALEASNTVIREQLDQLALYDLREEPDPQSVLQTRSNSQLIMVSRILEDASISVSDLNLIKSENVPIGASGSTPIASVQKQHFKLRGSSLYRDFLHALGKMQELPPTVAINNYQLGYIAKVGSQARVDVDLDFSFNFLMKPPTSAPGGAGGGGSANSAFEQMMKSLGGAGSFLPEVLQHAARIRDWLDPPALAATGRLSSGPSGIRVLADGPVGFRTFRLADGRVVVDMPGLEVTHKQVVRVGRGGVRAARLAQFSKRPLVGRLVLDTVRGGIHPRKVRNGVIVALPQGGAGRTVVARPAGTPAPLGQAPLGQAPLGQATLGRPATPVVLPTENQGPAVRATPMPEAYPVPVAAARPAPAPDPEAGETFIRRVQVRTPAETDVRRIEVRPDTRDIIVAVQWAPPSGMGSGGAPPPAGAPGAAPGGPPPGVVPGGPPPGAPPVGAPPAGKVAGGIGASAAPTAGGTGSVQAGRKTGSLSLPEVRIGRLEPFFPLIDATDDLGFRALDAQRASESASASATGSLAIATASAPPPSIVATQPIVIRAPEVPVAVATPPPPPRLAVALRGVLMGGSEATGLFEVDGQFVRARAGSSLGVGYTVRAIGRDFALVSSPFGTERKELLRTWNPVVPPAARQATPAPQAAPAPPTSGNQIPLQGQSTVAAPPPPPR